MSTISRYTSMVKSATNSTFGTLGIALPVVFLPAAIYGFADMEVMSTMTQDAQDLVPTGGADQQGLLIVAALKLTGLDILLELIFGPFIAASAIYAVATRREERDPTLYGAINFSLSRYKRLFLWHAAAQLSIKLGMLILIPGVLFLMMYAMVDPVLCFEKERWPLDRSKRLTRAWRKTIFLFMLPWILLVAVVPLFLFWSSQQGGMTTFGVSVFYYLSLYWLHSGFGWLYLERLEAGKKARAQLPSTESSVEGGETGPDVEETKAAAIEGPEESKPVPVTSKKGVQPMGIGQKLGLSVVGLVIAIMAYSSCNQDPSKPMNPDTPVGSEPVPADAGEAPTVSPSPGEATEGTSTPDGSATD